VKDLEYLLPSLAMVALMGFLSGTAVYWVVRHVKRQQETRKADEEEAARRFERSVLRSLGMGPGRETPAESLPPASPVPPPSVPARGARLAAPQDRERQGQSLGALLEPPLQAASPPPDAAASCLAGGLPKEIQSALDRLETAGLLADAEGPVHLGASLPPGYQFRLKNGKRLLALPSETPLEVITAQGKLVDYVLVARENRSALICQSLSDFIAGNLFPN
jgi:hypothetical protein